MKTQHRKKWGALAALTLAAPLFWSTTAQAEGRLTIYCNVQNSTCEIIKKRFSEKFNVETEFVHGSTGTFLGKLKAEKDNPQADIWYGGTVEPHYQAGDLGLLEEYRSPVQSEIMPQFKALMDKHGATTSIGYMLVLSLGVNTEKLKQLGIEKAPETWEDLLDPRLKGEIQIPDPRTSGTSYTLMATLISLLGEDKAFDYLKKLDKQISQYPKSSMVNANLSRGESTVAVSFVHAYIAEKEKGAPVIPVVPKGGVGYALGGVSIIKGARNLENAKLFMDWILGVEGQELPWRENHVYQIPSNVNAKAAPQTVDPKKLDLLKLDFDKFGSSTEGKRLIDRWVKEVKRD